MKILPELFNEILSYFRTLPSTYYAATQDVCSLNRYRERSDFLRALSQTSRTLRSIALPLLWARLDAWYVPNRAKGTWYKYMMLELKRKADGVRKTKHLHSYIQVLTFQITKSSLEDALSSLTALLKVPTLANLRTIHVIDCDSPGPLTKALSGVKLPSVRTVIVPNSAHGVLRSCPNVVEVRCVGGSGKELVGALKLCKCEVFEGYVDWTPKLMERLIKNAPLLSKIEIRRPVNNGLGILSQNYAPPEWATVIPRLSQLPNLTVIHLTFPGKDILASDEASIKAARAALLASAAKDKKELHVRRVIAPHYTNGLEDELYSSSVETL